MQNEDPFKDFFRFSQKIGIDHPKKFKIFLLFFLENGIFLFSERKFSFKT